ncbi:thioredoxin-like protein [Myxozyma melibiosi]|uniref:Thioredoxin-like protein n=1 Tax=Myxozyma melibiosi TaxID=54550 RepID=A0ABR1FCW3_9ASCO
MKRAYVLVIVLAMMVSCASAAFYGKDSEVINLTPKTFRSEVYDTNYTTIVEYYAEWCGHCKNLRPHYAKAAKSLSGLAKVAAVRCDDPSNERLCAKANIKGYPTLKIYRPSKRAKSTPIVEDYQGARTAKAITGMVLDRLSNRVTRLSSAADVEGFVAQKEVPRVLLFTDKPNTPPMFKVLAIDFDSSARFGIVRKADKALQKRFGVKKMPTVVVVTNDEEGEEEEERAVYEGEIKKEQLYEFLSGFATPAEGRLKGVVPANSPQRYGLDSSHDEL